MNWLYIGSVLLAGLLSVSEYIKTKKPYKLVYILFWVYLFIGAPVLEKITSNRMILGIYLIIGIGPSVIFAYWDTVKTNKEKSKPVHER